MTSLVYTLAQRVNESLMRWGESHNKKGEWAMSAVFEIEFIVKKYKEVVDNLIDNCCMQVESIHVMDDWDFKNDHTVPLTEYDAAMSYVQDGKIVTLHGVAKGGDRCGV